MDETKTSDPSAQDQPRRRASDMRQSEHPQSGDRKTVEEWAKQKGLIKVGAAPGGRDRIEVQFAAARGLMGWNVGQEVTESDFDQAVEDAMNIRIG